MERFVQNVGHREGHMKYENEFKSTTNKEEFVKMLIETYPHIKKQTAVRRWYDLRKEFGIQNDRYPKDEMDEPPHLKILMFQDMIKFKKDIDRQFLMKYGFTVYEINWLANNNMLER